MILFFSVPGIRGLLLSHQGHFSTCLHYHPDSVNTDSTLTTQKMHYYSWSHFTK